MKSIIYLVPVLIGLSFGCKKNDSAPTIQSQTFEVNSTPSKTWKYFSFASNDTITVTDPLTSTAWDLAFQRYRIRTNSGKSGNGLGSAANSYVKGQIGFDALKIVSDTATFSFRAAFSARSFSDGPHTTSISSLNHLNFLAADVYIKQAFSATSRSPLDKSTTSVSEGPAKDCCCP